MTGTDVVVGLVIAVGLIGIVLPVLPGTLLVAAAVLAWAGEVGSPTGWTVFAIVAVLLITGTVVKYLVPGRRLRRDAIPTSTLVVGGMLGVVAFFVVPVVGLPIGFLLGIYLAERRRLRTHALAWSATKQALRQVGLSILIELLASLAAAATWLVGVVVV